MMRSKLFVLAFLFVGCFSASGGAESETGGTTSETGVTSTTVSTSEPGTTSETGSTSGDTDTGSGTTGDDTSTSGSGTSTESCPVGMAFNQGYCWAVAMCDEASCSGDGDNTYACQSNVETCAAYGLEPTPPTTFLMEWSQPVVQDIADQLGLDGVDPEGSSGSPIGYWNNGQNTLRPAGYGFAEGYLNTAGCVPTTGSDWLWPLHTCVPPR